jgi:hypothetical protein
MDRCIEDRFANRNRDAVLAGTVVVRICRTLTVTRKPILNPNEILVLVGICMASIPNTDPSVVDGELEGFVLGALDNSFRYV